MVVIRGVIAKSLASLGVAGLGTGLIAHPAFAQTAGDPVFQTFFENTVCNNPPAGSNFLARCLETFDPTQPPNQRFANISAASESSLRPNQVSTNVINALAGTKAVADMTEARLEELRDEEQGKPESSTGKIAGFGPWSVFASVNGEWLDQSRSAFANERGYDGRLYGGTLGVDYGLNAASRVGLMVSYNKASIDFDAEPASLGFSPPEKSGEADTKTMSITAFMLMNLSDGAWIDAAAGLGWADNEFKRNAIFQPSTRATSLIVNTAASPEGKQWFGSLGIGYDHTDGPFSIGPYVRGQYVRAKIDGYTETDQNNTGLAFEVDGQKATSLLGIVGIRTSYAISASWGVVVPQARFEYEHEFEDDARSIITRFVQDPTDRPFTVTNDSPDRDHFNAGLSLAFILPNGISPYVDYEALLGYSDFSRHRLTAGLRVEF